MVAVIHSGKSLREALNYNERKVENQVATFLDAGFYPKDPIDLTFKQKLSRLQNLINLNQKVKINTLHISLNFAPGEDLSKEQLREISGLYLDKIGFARQPYLLYQHHDSGHPHVHLITTNIKADGSSIKLHNIGRNQSEKARKEIEIEYGLVKAEDHKRLVFQVNPVSVQKVQYSKSETKKAISGVLNSVIKDYKYASLPELNAILKQYNVTADRGNEESRIYKNDGLVYRILDETGNRVGVPIKASDFHLKPTSKYLRERFEINEVERSQYRSKLKNTIDFVLQNQSKNTVNDLAQQLEKQGVKVVLRQSETGILYGITYIDYRTKCVFNGSSLEKTYSAKGISERCEKPDLRLENKPVRQVNSVKSSSRIGREDKGNRQSNSFNVAHISPDKSTEDSLLEDLFSPTSDYNPVPWQLRKSRRKSRKKLS